MILSVSRQSISARHSENLTSPNLWLTYRTVTFDLLAADHLFILLSVCVIELILLLLLRPIFISCGRSQCSNWFQASVLVKDNGGTQDGSGMIYWHYGFPFLYKKIDLVIVVYAN